jgi:DNA repair exonuclease
MTTIVHTADVHLDPDRPARMEGLRSVMQAAEDAEAELLTIGGDLFETPEDVDALRTPLRNEVFTEDAVPTLLIPGNHDEAAFRGNLDFGPSCSVVLDPPVRDLDVRRRGRPHQRGAVCGPTGLRHPARPRRS